MVKGFFLSQQLSHLHGSMEYLGRLLSIWEHGKYYICFSFRRYKGMDGRTNDLA